MRDLNDLYYFAKVIEHGGFNAASRTLGIPKSRLSRRVADLEERLGVRLLQRTTRRLALTEVGTNYLAHCQAMLAEADAADEAIARVQAEPRGQIRVSCPELLAKTLLAPALTRYMQRHPQVRVWLEITNRRVDLIEEGIDVALRVRNQIEDSASLVARRIGISRVVTIASPALLAEYGTPTCPAELARFPALVTQRPDGRGQWSLMDAGGHEHTVLFDAPRLISDDMVLLAEAAIGGLGVAMLPSLVCEGALNDGRLVTLLPAFEAPGGILHAAFPSRRGLIPAVRSFIDFLAAELIPSDHPGYQRLGGPSSVSAGEQ
ncbi:LysR substrate-binding domain-containing protein [Crenobacter sp. SG2305]|uniref:LysR substrate-binding domain-containing protein n=1 Tax=Crenobacter oryzisoli TaxID=3056844 RepID=UPI0025AB259A|nr:LysR substrate-binding domain-containing protein [Crenobacter sp. SG2305]MDN0084165.1 LysR substrate-binding domain-containing protein [Crenobacter sp. SG2305]